MSVTERSTVTALEPVRVVRGGRLWLHGSAFPVPLAPREECEIGGVPSRVVFSAPDRVALEVPPGLEGGSTELKAPWLPGALMRNTQLRFTCKDSYLRVERSDTPFTRGYNAGQVIAVPVAHVAALAPRLLPGFVVGRKITARQKQIENGLPDALDLMIVCLEAGSGLDQAIMKVSDELELAYPALAEEFRFLLTETRAGKPRLEAFRNFSKRTGVDDVRALVAMLVQTDRFGTSVSQALRTHAEVSRTKRRQRAEEKAAKLGVKLVFPLVFCLFPAFFVVTLGPALIRFIRVMFGQILG